MSVYGRLWQKCAEVRQEIAERFPGFHSVSLDDCKRQIESLQRLVERWEKLEAQMRATPED